ncbi:MAG TPA: DJ-1/PfpI family protein [bacterium (Candidatus Stahlbacteria)]|nr:DJ-1/PfpI family protein [Candidatus Stahlbacteria bacterium]
MITQKYKPILAIVLGGLIFGCAKKEVKPIPKIQGKKVLMIIASKNFRDEELETPMSILKTQGARVTIASSSLDTATGMLGAKATPNILITDVNVADYDAIIFVGGSGASEYWNDLTAHEIAKRAVEQNKILCAICIAPVTLANAGVLEGRKATAWSSEKDKLELKGATYTGTSVQVDGNIITANGPAAAKEFGETIVKALAAK